MISQDQSAQTEESIWELLLLQIPLLSPSSFLSIVIISFWVNMEEKKSRKKYEGGLWGLGGRQQSGPPGRSLLLSHETLLVFPFLESPDTVFLFGAWQKQNKTKTTNHNDNFRMIPVPKRESFSLWQIDNHSMTEPEVTIASQLCSVLAIRTPASASHRRSKEYVCVRVQLTEKIWIGYLTRAFMQI